MRVEQDCSVDPTPQEAPHVLSRSQFEPNIENDFDHEMEVNDCNSTFNQTDSTMTNRIKGLSHVQNELLRTIDQIRSKNSITKSALQSTMNATFDFIHEHFKN